MKKLMLCILLLSGFFSMKLCAQDFVIDNLEYTILSSGDRTVGVKCANTEIDSLYIPPEVSFNGENYTVTSIISYGLCHCSALKHISLPAKLEHIENFAMMGLNQLEEIKIPNTVKSIARRTNEEEFLKRQQEKAQKQSEKDNKKKYRIKK